MRSFALHVLSLGILTANIGLASPVPESGGDLKASSSAEVHSGSGRGDGIVDDGTTNVVADLVSHHPETGSIDGLFRFCSDDGLGDHGRACPRKRSDEAEAGEPIPAGYGQAATGDVGLGADPSVSPNVLFSRQVVGPILVGVSRPCAKAIAAKYEHADFKTMSLADKKAFINEIIDCVYDQSNTSQNSRAREVAGANVASATRNPRCREDLIFNANFRDHNPILWWIALGACFNVDDAPPQDTAPPPERRKISPDLVKDQACAKNVVQGWTGDLSTKKDQDAFILAISGCINHSTTILAA